MKKHKRQLNTKPRHRHIPAFYASAEWKRVRYEALKRSLGRCECCGAGPAQGAVLNVDHIKSRRRFPKKALDINNLQVLCASCNQGKGNWDSTDWRMPTTTDAKLDLEMLASLRERGLLN
jgi:5-methylcytosine-specific restriction endonuclease McrA